MRSLLLILLFILVGCNGSDPKLTPLGKQVANIPIPETTYAIAIYAEGLSGAPMVLSLNGESNLDVSQNGVAVFSKQLKLNVPFEVSILTQPTNRNCYILNSVGTIDGQSSDIRVKCAPIGSYYIGGPISGLDSGEIQISLGNFETTRVQAGSATYAFSWYVGNGPITLTINNSGTTRACKFSSNQSDSLVVTVANANINDLQINCTAPLSNVVTMSGTITGISGSSLSIIQSNGAPFTLNTNGNFNIAGSFFEGQRFALELVGAANRYCYFNESTTHLFSHTPVASKSDIDITCIPRTVANECSKGTGELPATNGTISAVDCLKDKILYGGNFSLIGHQKGILKLDTTVATSITEPTRAFDRIHGKINKIISDNNGGYFVAGLFNKVGDKRKRNLVRLDSRLIIDESFNIEADAEVNDIDLSGNDLFVSGLFKNLIINDQLYFRNALARISLVSSTPSIVAFSFPSAFYTILKGYKTVTEIVGSYIYINSTWSNRGLDESFGLLRNRNGAVTYVLNKSTGGLISYYRPSVTEDGSGLFWQDTNNQTWYLHPEVGMINPSTGAAHLSQAEIPYTTSSSFFLDGNDLYIYSTISGVKTIKKIDLTTLGGASSTLFKAVAITNPTSAVFNATRACFFGSDVGGRKSIGCFSKADGTLLPFNPFPNSQTLSTGIFEGDFVVTNAQFATATSATSSALIDSITRAPILPSFSMPINGTVNSITNDGTYFYLAGTFTDFGGCAFCDKVARISSSTSLVDTTWHPSADNFFPGISSIDINGSSLFISLTSSYSLYQMQLSNLNIINQSTTPVYFSQVQSIASEVLTRTANSITYSSSTANGLASWTENTAIAQIKIIKTSSHFYGLSGSKVYQLNPNGVSVSTLDLGAVPPLNLTTVAEDKICVLMNLTTTDCYSTTSGIFTKENSVTHNAPPSITIFNKIGNFIFLAGPNSAPLQIPL